MRRRSFLRSVLAGVASACVLPAAEARGAASSPAIARGARVLFQGDSITDGGRWRDSDDPNHVFGQSYAYLLAADLGGRHPAMGWRFVNRGVGGDTVKALAARWDRDVLALRPDLLSILVGANDTASRFDPGIPLPTTVAEYGAIYAQLLARTRAALPNVKLVLCEPFALPGVRNAGHWDAWREDLAQRQTIVRKLAHAHGAAFVPLQDRFDAACRRAPAAYWIWDGVHPTYAGHRLLADGWLRALGAAGQSEA